MSLLLSERGPLDQLPSTQIKALARARTLRVLPRLDGVRKGRVVQFLWESGLISNASAIVDLRGAWLREADLSGANLPNAKLSGADLSEANLSGAMLNDADLSRADLADADLSWASLIGGNLSNTHLAGASFIGASLGDAYLGEANLRGAYMSGCYMSGAYLENAKGVTNEELEQWAYSLEGATMPDGLKYEDWLKSKGKREK
jgi:Pentapeptide repeats (8 copies)